MKRRYDKPDTPRVAADSWCVDTLLSMFKRKTKLSVLKAALGVLVATWLVLKFIERGQFHWHRSKRSPFLQHRLGAKLAKQLNNDTDNDSSTLTLYSKCYCQKEVVTVSKASNNVYNVRIERADSNDSRLVHVRSYDVDVERFEQLTFTCDLYTALRRGPHTRVIAYTTHTRREHMERLAVSNGQNYDYMRLMRRVERQGQLARRHYPTWTLRVYHAGELSAADMCEKQCATGGSDNLDFCDLRRVPSGGGGGGGGANSEPNSNSDDGDDDEWNFDYLAPTLWSWLPLADDFVDVFVSRPLSSCMSQREITHVNEWLASGSLFGFMIDEAKWRAPSKLANIMWGMVSGRDRALSEKLFSTSVDKYLSEWHEANVDYHSLRSYLDWSGGSGGSGGAFARSIGIFHYFINEYVWPFARNDSKFSYFLASSSSSLPTTAASSFQQQQYNSTNIIYCLD